MSKEAVFTMKLEPELRDQFMAEAEASHRPASQVVRELMREFVQRHMMRSCSARLRLPDPRCVPAEAAQIMRSKPSSQPDAPKQRG